MPHHLKTGIYNIISLVEGEPYVAVQPLTLPALKPVLVFKRTPGFVPPKWLVSQVGENLYTLVIEAYNAQVDGKKVIATIHEPPLVWLISYKENHDAYIIEKKGEGEGWTVPGDLGEHDQVLIAPIKATHSLPPQYAHNQLYRFEPLKYDE